MPDLLSKNLPNAVAVNATKKIYQIFAQRRNPAAVGLDCCDVDGCDTGGAARNLAPSI